MTNEKELKEIVRSKYSEIASQSFEQNAQSCCGATGSCSTGTYSIMSDDYTSLEGYNKEADLGLGCGVPTNFARLKEGDIVIDLGSGAGNDAFVVRQIVGEKGKVIGIDFTEKMIERARENAEKLQFNNVEFRFGDIDNMPITSNKADVIISNCVLNLVPNKHKVFSEIYRVLKPGAHFSISDIVLQGPLPESWQKVAELYAGCVSGAIQQTQYMAIIQEAGFVNTVIQKEKDIIIPNEILLEYFSQQEIDNFTNNGSKIKSITVYAEKPAKDERKCCEPGAGCC